MKLLTKELCNKIPYMNEGDGKAYVKFFCPWGSWTWYVEEAQAVVVSEDGKTELEMSLKEAVKLKAKIKDVLFYGLVDGFEKEKGYFALSELEELTGPFGLKIERDLYWTPERVIV